MISTKKQIAIALFALVLSVLAIALAQNAQDAADTKLNMSVGIGTVMQVYERNISKSLNVSIPQDTDFNIILNASDPSNKYPMMTLSGGGGVGFVPFDKNGPDFGTNICGFNARQPVESMTKNFFLFRCGQYVFENENAVWQMIITPSGVNIGSPADNNLVPKSRLEIDGNMTIGHGYSRTQPSPINGLKVQGQILADGTLRVKDYLYLDGLSFVFNRSASFHQWEIGIDNEGMSIYDDTSSAYRFIVKSNGDIKIGSLSGSGNAYVCVDSTGKLYRSSSACV